MHAGFLEEREFMHLMLFPFYLNATWVLRKLPLLYYYTIQLMRLMRVKCVIREWITLFMYVFVFDKQSLCIVKYIDLITHMKQLLINETAMNCFYVMYLLSLSNTRKGDLNFIVDSNLLHW